MFGRSYLKTVAMSVLKSVFPDITGNEDKKIKLFLLSVLIFPIVLYRAYFQSVIPYIELVVTPKCNLNCAGCANLMPCYDKAAPHIDFDVLKNSLDALFSISKRIETIKFIGGEPFLYSRLGELVAYAAKNKSVKNIIITTNGSVTPKKAILEGISHPKVIVDISDYPMVNSQSFIDHLKSNNIAYRLIEFSSWFDYGETNVRNMPDEMLKLSFQKCASAECKTLLNGKLYICPRAAHGAVLSLIPTDENEFVDILAKKEERRSFKKLYSRPFINACDYCTPVWKRNEIECGVQIKQ